MKIRKTLRSSKKVGTVLTVIMVISVFAALFMSPSAAAKEDASDKISSYLKYAMEHGSLEIEPVEKISITPTEKPAKPLGIAGIKAIEELRGPRKGKPLPSVIGGAIVTEAPLTEAQIQQLEALGVGIRSRMRNVTTVNMPTALINEIAAWDFVRYIEGPKPARMHLDAAVPEMAAPTAWAQGCTGKDVIIGIVDTGIDWTHGDFWFDAAKTSSKILYIWDQTDGTGPAPAPYGYGTEWTRADIEAGTCTETDDDGHGTHVAGIAASSGKETGNYKGVAPSANIVFVKTMGWTDAYIDGWNYIVQRAQAEGKPCVISCSWGSYFSSHDEFDPWAQAADWCAAQGVQVICSAGNEGDWPVHATIQQPRTVIWSDDFESGFGNWVTDAGTPTWHLVDTRWTSYNHSAWPGDDLSGVYVDDQISTMTMANSVDLSATTYPLLAFQLWPEIEFDWDYLYVDVSSDGGATWREVWFYSDYDANWRGMLVDLTPYKSNQVNARFRFKSDFINTYEGPYIDNVMIYDQVDDCGGTYSSGETYNLEVALDCWCGESVVDLYYDLDDNVSIEVWTGNGYVAANEADAIGSGANWDIEIYYLEGPNWKNYFIYAYDEDLSYNETIEIHVNNVNPEGVNRWDAWTLHKEEWWGYFRDVNDMDYFKSVGSPASALTCKAVGAYTTKTTWDSIDGSTYTYTHAVMDELACLSSHGPTRDCRMKPELTASGFGVMSALSGDASIDIELIDPYGEHQMMAGTSCSAPMVAGAFALALECNPNATPSELNSYFMNTAREDSFTGTTWPTIDNQYWGAGKINSSCPCLQPSIEVNKTVWDPEKEEWVKEINANISDLLTFKCEIHNNCCNLTEIWVGDYLSLSMEYADNATVNGIPCEPDLVGPQGDFGADVGPKTIGGFYWYYDDGRPCTDPFKELAPCETITIKFDARVIECGEDFNTQYARGWCEETEEWVDDEDTVTINVPQRASIDIEKWVKYKDEPDSAYRKAIEDAEVCDNVTFKIAIHNDGTCTNLTGISVTDKLNCSLGYVEGSASIIPEYENCCPETQQELEWTFPEEWLEPCEYINITFDAHVDECGNDTNYVYVWAENETGYGVSDEETVWVNCTPTPTPTPTPPVSVETATGTGTATFQSDVCTIVALGAIDEGTLPPDEGKPDLEFPQGFFSFHVICPSPGGTVTLTIELPDAVPVGTEYWKYGPTLANLIPHWYSIPIGSDDGDNIITITITDGGIGDNDLTENGEIVDPGGPGIPPPVPVPEFSAIGLLSLIGILSVVVAIAVSRKK